MGAPRLTSAKPALRFAVLEAADRYAELRRHPRVAERALFAVEKMPAELELQARWFAGDFGRRFKTTDGRDVEIVQFGVWNRQAGPDFRGAAVRFAESEPVRGAIEFDLSDRNWETHGHAVNPAFDDAVLHVFALSGPTKFFTRTSSNREVPQVNVDLATLPDRFSANVPLAQPGRCQAPLKDLADDRVHSILEGAAQFRLRRKAMRVRANIESHGRDEALFQHIAGAFGYKQNKLPFTLVAQRVPLEFSRKQPEDIHALLFGVAGFLEKSDLRQYDAGARTYLRKLWDRWWRHRDAMQRLVLPGNIWRLGGARPLNHPQRRLGALGALTRNWKTFAAAIEEPNAARVADFFRSLHDGFWDFHYTLVADPVPRAMALVGESRIAEILANVVFPYFHSQGAQVWADYARLSARLSNRRLATAATRLFGEGARAAAFTKTIAHQQGLLQIYEDFCMQDNSDCAQCPFPEQMQKWK